MASAVAMPKLGPAVTEATILTWQKKVGDEVKKGDVLVVVETDLAEVEVRADQDGYLLRIDADPEMIVACGETIALIGARGETA